MQKNASSLVVVDPSLRDLVGHHFEYDKAVAVAAREAGRAVTVLGHAEMVPEVLAALSAVPTFTRDIWKPYPEEQRLGNDDAIRIANAAFCKELRKGLSGTSLEGDAVIFGHMITHRQLWGWAEFAREAAGPDGPEVVLLLRYQASFYERPICERAFRLLERTAKTGRIRLVSDSERLAGQLQRLTSLPVATVPIPHTSDIGVHLISPRASSGRLRVVSLGNARDEKGLLEILQAIRILEVAGFADHFEFALQVNDPDAATAPAIEKFATEDHPHTTLYRRALSSAEYYDLLESADLVAVPYWRQIYEARTSGIFLEALAASKPVLCTQDTWMSDQLRANGAGLLVKDRDARDLVKQLLKARADYSELRAKAQAGRAAWLEYHNPRSTLTTLLGSTRGQPSARFSRAAVLYPWGDARQRTAAGASVRVNQLADFLAGQADEVRLLQNADHGREIHREITIEAYHSDAFMARDWRIRALGWVCRVLLGARDGEELYLLMHIAAALDTKMKRRMLELARWADVIFLKYSFWAPAAAPACKEAGVPLVLATYDVVSDMVKHSRVVRMLTRWAETRALKSVPMRIAVSPEDQLRFAEQGVETRVIPHSVDAHLLGRKPSFATRELLLDLCGLPVDVEHLFLFVGSRYAPNIAAAQNVAGIAKAFAERYPAVKAHFVIAGACRDPGDGPRLKSLGRVSDLTLRLLYENARAIIIPLEFGTGSSLKSIEALAYGRCVLGTSVAFRGLAVHDGRHCLVSDDLRDWPGILEKVCKVPVMRRQLEARARAFAGAYDFRQVFKRYAELLGPAAPQRQRPAQLSTDPAYLDYLRSIVATSIEHGHRDVAKSAVREILCLVPDDPEALSARVTLLARGGTAALPVIENAVTDALAAGGDVRELLHARADARRRAGQEARADADDRMAVQFSVGESWTPFTETRLRERVWREFHVGNRSWVRDVCEAILRERTTSAPPDYPYLLAHCLQDLNEEPQLALQLHQTALDSGFAPYWPRFHRVNLLERIGRSQEARREIVLAAAAAENPDQLGQVVRVAEADLWRTHHAGSHGDAAEAARMMLAWKPDSAAAHYILAESLRELGAAPRKVLKQLKIARSFGHAECWIWLSHGWLQRREKDETEALRAFAQARACSNNDWLTRYVTDEIEGRLWRLLEERDRDSVVRHAQLVLEALPENPDARYALACVGLEYSALPDVQDRITAVQRSWAQRLSEPKRSSSRVLSPHEVCERYITASPAERRLLQDELQKRLWELFNTGAYQQTLELAGRAAEAAPEFAHAQYLRAECTQILQGNLSAAVAYYDAALANGFDRFWSLFNRAQAKRKTGRTDEAVQDLFDALQAATSTEQRRRIQAAARDLEREFQKGVPRNLRELLSADASSQTL